MSTFAVTTAIQAPRIKVWDILADIGTITEWNLGVIESHLTFENRGDNHDDKDDSI